MWYVTILPESKDRNQRGRSNKYASKELSSASPFAQPDIAILAACSSCIGLFRECPEKGLRIPQKELVRVDIDMSPLLDEVSETYEKMVSMLVATIQNTSSLKRAQKQRNRHDINPSIKAAIEGCVDTIWIKHLNDLASANVLEGKVSGVELEFSTGNNSSEFKGLSLTGDFNSQLILEKIMMLKSEQDDDDYDEESDGY